MKWQQDAKISPDVQDRLNERVAKFIAENGSNDGAKDSAAVLVLCLDLYSIYHGLEGTDDDVEKLFDFASIAEEWDTDEPKLTHIQKYINRLFAGRDQSAYRYIDSAINEQIAADAEVAAATMSRNGSLGGTASQRAKVKAIAQAQEHYRQHHSQFRNKKEAARHYEELFPPVKFSTYYRILRKPKV